MPDVEVAVRAIGGAVVRILVIRAPQIAVEIAIANTGGGPFSLSPDETNLLLVRVDDAASDLMLVRPFR